MRRGCVLALTAILLGGALPGIGWAAEPFTEADRIRQYQQFMQPRPGGRSQFDFAAEPPPAAPVDPPENRPPGGFRPAPVTPSYPPSQWQPGSGCGPGYYMDNVLGQGNCVPVPRR